MRVVLDPNVLVSAAISTAGPPRRIMIGKGYTRPRGRCAHTAQLLAGLPASAPAAVA